MKNYSNTINIPLIMLLFLSLPVVITAQGKWNVQNPFPTESYLLTVEPVTDNIIYAGGLGGTLIKANNAGITWSVEKFKDLVNIRSICFVGTIIHFRKEDI